MVPLDSPPAQRRDWILNGLATEGGRWTHLTPAQLKAALAEPIVLAGDKPLPNRTGQFSWQVRRELDGILGDPQGSRDGRLHRHHDARLAGPAAGRALDDRGGDRPEPAGEAGEPPPRLAQDPQGRPGAGSTRLRGKDLHNGALVALDYRTGDVLAYVGSAGYTRDDLASRKFAPEVRRRPATACASPGRRSSRSSTRAPSTTIG